MTNIDITKINGFIHKAENSLKICQKWIGKSLAAAPSEPMSFEETARMVQLILQYRLDCEDVLVALLKLDRHILYILGIQPTHAASINLERITYALGKDDLNQILHALSRLVDALLRIAARARKTQANYSVKRSLNKKYKPNRMLLDLQDLPLKQNELSEEVLQVEKALEPLVELEVTNPIYNEIMALRKPIHHLCEELQHGFEQTQQLYQKINNHLTVEQGLDSLVNSVQEVLTLMPSLYQPQPHYSLGHFMGKSSEQLEERAAAKRLQPFFRPS